MKDIDLLPLFDLQLFADGDADASGNETATTKGDTGDNKPTEETKSKDDGKAKPITEEDVQARIADALEKAKGKWEKDYQKKAEAQKKEQERLSKLSEDERRSAELENSKKELEAREKELKRKELKLEMVKVLADRNIPVEFMDYLVDEDNESTMKRITTFEKAYKKAVEAGVNEKLKGKAPNAGGVTQGQNGNANNSSGFLDAIYKNQSKR
ncbi:MAG: DUF4355 domain-containing protein [Schwartzia sp.]|nr:DUF4355 domain-containing protein [Schwartzia sp. (in: firmicutes)]